MIKLHTIVLTGLAILNLVTASLWAQKKTWKKEVTQLFDQMVVKPEIPTGFLLLHSDSLELHLELVSGQDSLGNDYDQNTTLYLASIGKTYTATLIMQLKDQGKLELDQPISEYLPSDLIGGLHRIDEIERTQDITIHHLLSHTSGLPDYFGDQPLEGSNMFDMLLEQPDKFWTPVELITFSKGRFKAHFPPGEGFYYSDTGYVLLGMIIESLTGLPLHEAYQKMLFEPLGMNRSFMNLRSSPNKEAMADFYFDHMKITRLTSLSADWGGGGPVSSLTDLKTFLHALNSSKIVSDASFNAMQQWLPESYGSFYGYGLRKLDLQNLDPSLPKLTLVGHSGATASFMYYCPELDLYLVGTFNQISADHLVNSFLTQVISKF